MQFDSTTFSKKSYFKCTITAAVNLACYITLKENGIVLDAVLSAAHKQASVQHNLHVEAQTVESNLMLATRSVC